MFLIPIDFYYFILFLCLFILSDKKPFAQRAARFEPPPPRHDQRQCRPFGFNNSRLNAYLAHTRSRALPFV